MKGLYYARVNKDNIINTGVIEKCRGQTEGFKHFGVEVDLLWLGNSGVFLNEKLLKSFKMPWLKYNWSKYLFFFFHLTTILKYTVNIQTYNFLYFRHSLAHPMLLYWFSFLKKANPSLIILLEIPTYPYDLEPQKLFHRIALKIDQLQRRKLHKYINYIITCGIEKSIWNIPTINIRNGISTNLNMTSNLIYQGQLNLIAVGNWSYWHGLDRLIKGIGKFRGEYNGKLRVTLNIVGQGNAVKSYKEMVLKKGLEDWIKFFPPSKGEALDKLFMEANIGIGNLGLHRKKVILDSSLKHREYCARTLPFILSSNDPDFPAELPFIKYFPPDDSEIDVFQILFFFKELASKQHNLKEKMLRHTNENLLWRKKLLPIVEKLRSDNKVV